MALQASQKPHKVVIFHFAQKEVELLKLVSRKDDANLSFVSVSSIFHAMAPIFSGRARSFA